MEYVLITDPKTLFIGKEVYIKYPEIDRYIKHKIRKRIFLNENNIPIFDPVFGRHYDETIEEYNEYRRWISNRLKKNQLYECSEDKEPQGSSPPQRNTGGSKKDEDYSLF